MMESRQAGSMIGETRQLVTNEPVEFENNRLKFKTAGKLPIILEEFVEYTRVIRKVSLCFDRF